MPYAQKKGRHSARNQLSESVEFPILFTINGPKRHELLITSTTASLRELAAQIEDIVTNSPNSQEFMSKYKKQSASSGEGDKVKEVRVRWSGQGRDLKWWPQTTVLTEDNVDAVLALVERAGVGKDVLEVTMEGDEGEPKGE